MNIWAGFRAETFATRAKAGRRKIPDCTEIVRQTRSYAVSAGGLTDDNIWVYPFKKVTVPPTFAP